MTARTLLAAVALAAPAVSAEAESTALEFARLPLSVRQQAAGLYGSYDVFKVAANPALLAFQPRVWEGAFSNQLMFGGAQNVWGVGAGWAGAPSDAGSFGAALIVSGLSSDRIEDLDVLGNPTGVTVSSSALRIGAAGAWQWQGLGLGIAVWRASESYSGLTGADAVADQSALLASFGAAVRIGAAELGAAYEHRGGDAAGQVAAGGAYRLPGPLRGAVGGEVTVPVGGVAGPFGEMGVTWNAHRLFDIRVGALVPSGEGGGIAARAGFTVNWSSLSFDYALGLPLGTGPGVSHLFGVSWAGGPERRPAWRPRARFASGDRASTIAVASFEPQGVSASDAAVVSDLLRSALVKEGSFSVVEKANMDRILAEQTFQQTGCTTSECAVKLGKILNVKYLVVGSFGKSMGQHLVALRVVEIETARIVYSDEAVGGSLDEIRRAVNEMAARLSGAVR